MTPDLPTPAQWVHEHEINELSRALGELRDVVADWDSELGQTLGSRQFAVPKATRVLRVLVRNAREHEWQMKFRVGGLGLAGQPPSVAEPSPDVQPKSGTPNPGDDEPTR